MPDLDPGTQMVLLFFVLLFLRVPVAFALGLSSLYAMWAIGFGLDLVGDLLASGISKFSLLAIPFFILAGTLMGTVGIAERMIRFFRVLVGSLPGGMGIVGTVVCLFWGAVSGSGPASVAAIGPLIIKGMAEDGYPRALRSGAGVHRRGAVDRHPALDRPRHLRRHRRNLDCRAVHRGDRPRHGHGRADAADAALRRPRPHGCRPATSPAPGSPRWSRRPMPTGRMASGWRAPSSTPSGAC